MNPIHLTPYEYEPSSGEISNLELDLGGTSPAQVPSGLSQGPFYTEDMIKDQGGTQFVNNAMNGDIVLPHSHWDDSDEHISRVYAKWQSANDGSNKPSQVDFQVPTYSSDFMDTSQNLDPYDLNLQSTSNSPSDVSISPGFATSAAVSASSESSATTQTFKAGARPKEQGPITCSNCSTQATPLWRRGNDGLPVCNACGLFMKLHGIPRPLSLKTDVFKKRKRSSCTDQLPGGGRIRPIRRSNTAISDPKPKSESEMGSDEPLGFRLGEW